MITGVSVALSPEDESSPSESLDKYLNFLKMMDYCAERGREKLFTEVRGMRWRTIESASRENGFAPGRSEQHFEIFPYPQPMLSPAWCMLSFIIYLGISSGKRGVGRFVLQLLCHFP